MLCTDARLTRVAAVYCLFGNFHKLQRSLISSAYIALKHVVNVPDIAWRIISEWRSKNEKHINVLEGRVALLGIPWLLWQRAGTGRRITVLTDSRYCNTCCLEVDLGLSVVETMPSHRLSVLCRIFGDRSNLGRKWKNPSDPLSRLLQTSTLRREALDQKRIPYPHLPIPSFFAMKRESLSRNLSNLTIYCCVIITTF